MSTTTEETKQITFEGLTYTVPTWVKWVARDERGEISAFEYNPARECDFWSENEYHIPSRVVVIGWTYWEDSLAEV